MSYIYSKIRNYFASSIIVMIARLIGHSLSTHYRLAKVLRKHPTLKIDIPIKIIFDRSDSLRLGKNIFIGQFSEIVALEITPFSPIKGSLEIGDRVIIGKGANIRAAGGQIVIGENALLAQDVSLIAANHQLSKALPYRDQPWDTHRFGVTVGRNVWIGAGVTVLPGVEIGENSVVGAGSVVTRNIPSNQLWAGNPARLIRYL